MPATVVTSAVVSQRLGCVTTTRGSTTIRLKRTRAPEVLAYVRSESERNDGSLQGRPLGKNPNATMRALVNGIDGSDGLIGAVGNFVMEPWLGHSMEQWVFGVTPKGIAFDPIGRFGTLKPTSKDTRFVSFSLVTAFRYFPPRSEDDPYEHLEFEVRLAPGGPGYRFEMYVADFPVSPALLRRMADKLSDEVGVPPVENVRSPEPAKTNAAALADVQKRASRSSRRLGLRRPS